MKKYLLMIAATVAVASQPAKAAEFMFNFNGTALLGSPSVFGGSGVLTVSDTTEIVNGREAFKVLSATGTINGTAIAGLSGIFGANNFLFQTGPFVDGSGIGFRTTAGTETNLFFQSSASSFRVNAVNPFLTGFATANASVAQVAAVPEPSTWALMLLGFAGVGVAMRRQTKAKVNVSYA